MIFVTFELTSGRKVTLPLEKAQQVLQSKDSLVAITDSDGEWRGNLIHKSHIVSSYRDREAERENKIRLSESQQLNPAEPSEEEKTKMLEIRREIADRLNFRVTS